MEIDTQRTTPVQKVDASQYASEHDVSSEVVRAIAGVQGIVLHTNKTGGDCMGEFFNNLRNEGIALGKEEGIALGKAQAIVELGIEEGWSEDGIIDKITSRLGISVDQAQRYYDQFANGCVK